MILSKRCFISVINPASQEDEEGLSLSPATIAADKGTPPAPITAIYQISCLKMIPAHRADGLLNLWPHIRTFSSRKSAQIRALKHTHIHTCSTDKRPFLSHINSYMYPLSSIALKKHVLRCVSLFFLKS